MRVISIIKEEGITMKTVKEVMISHRGSKFWLCPNIVYTHKLGIDPLLQGIYCSVNSVPEEIEDKEALEIYRENEVICIIWKNQ
jgi:hypothetical protein